MNAQELNKRKSELLDQQEKMLAVATGNKETLTKAQEENFEKWTAEIDAINVNINRIEAINKGKREVNAPMSDAVIASQEKKPKYFAFGGARSTTPLNVDENYVSNFWKSLTSSADHERFVIQNAANLGELGTAAAGGALVPIQTDPTIPAMKIEETTARSLSRVITTSMDINVPYQSAKGAAALKAESNSSGLNAFSSNTPSFATTKLSAYIVGGQTTASWELLQDSKAANEFLPQEIFRNIRVKEENLFVTGSGVGQPQGYLGNATTATGASVTAGAATLGISPVLDVLGSLNKAYYATASWLVNRAESIRLLKAQLAANQYQTYFTFADGNWTLLGFPMAFSAEMPVYQASPAVQGAWLFGSFKDYAVIGDRDSSDVRIKVLDQVAALNGQTVILGYRRTDQRILLQEACVQLNTNG